MMNLNKMHIQNPRLILGVDPGTHILGYGIIQYHHQKITLKKQGIVRLQKNKTAYEKMRMIHQNLVQLLNDFLVTDIAIEDPFYGKNAQSMLQLGRVQGLIWGLAVAKNLIMKTYAPAKIKKSLTGQGNATKSQVAAMAQKICQTDIIFESMDASDALAIAICHAYQPYEDLFQNKQTNSWEAWARVRGL